MELEENSVVVLRWESFFEELESFIRSSNRFLRGGGASEAYAQFVIERFEIVNGNLVYVINAFNDNRPTDEDLELLEIWSTYLLSLQQLLSSCRSLVSQWEKYVDSLHQDPYPDSYTAPVVHRPHIRGRPPFNISRDQLSYLASLSFTWTEIAELLGVSRMTVYRRRCQFGMEEPRRSTLTDSELRTLVRTWKSEMPAIGETLVIGRLHASGHYVPRERVRHAIHAVDPLNTAFRSPYGLTRRRVYSVPGPNSLWHIDGHHKLIRWRLVTHAGIDGYSRMIVYMKCSDNNRSTTVYEEFVQAVQSYSLPSRLRCDQGRENILVAAHMLEHRGSDRQSVIVGSSVHNQRIERLWRDMHRCVTQLFYRLFYFLEYHNQLDPLNEAHLAAIHYIFLPRINLSLKHFKNGWNSHSVRTEHNHSPHQLFVSGVLRLHRRGLVATDFLESVGDSYGISEEGVSTSDAAVGLPRNTFQLRDDHFQELMRTINPLSDSNNYGIDLYLECLDFFRMYVSQHPTLYRNVL